MTTENSASTHGLGFLLVFAAPAMLVLSGLLGHATGWQAGFACWMLIVAFCVVPLLSVIGINWNEPDPLQNPGLLGRAMLRGIPLAAVPVQLVTLWCATGHWMDPSLGPVGRIGWVLSTGTVGALFGITVAHELIHHRGAIDRAAGGILLSTLCFGTFRIVHLHVHHRFVATPRDFGSAPRGLSLYRFWLRSLVANVTEAVRYEYKRNRGRGLPAWWSELTIWYALSCVWLALCLATWGWMGGAFFLLQSLVAVMVLDLTNYVQHYGLRRPADENGRYGAVQPDHSWAMQCRVSNLALLNLLRHGDHHARQALPYYALSHTKVPAYPYPFGFMMALALVPPLFRRVVHPLLDAMAAVRREPA